MLPEVPLNGARPDGDGDTTLARPAQLAGRAEVTGNQDQARANRAGRCRRDQGRADWHCAIPAGADVRAVEIDKAGYLTGGGAAARVRVAVTADRGDLVAITLNIYQNRQALDVDGYAWWG